MPVIVEQYGAAAGVLAAEWYDQARAKAGVSGPFRAEPVDLGTAGAEELVGYGATSLTDADPDFLKAQTLLSGGLQRRIANYARQTITTAAVQDAGALGWVRTGKGECDWCQRYIDGEVRTVAGYDFKAHDNCNCYANPVWR